MCGTKLCLSILTKVIESYMMPTRKNIPIKLNIKDFDCGLGLLLELFLNEKDESFTQLPEMETEWSVD